MIKPETMLQESGGGGGGSYTTTTQEPAPADEKDYLQPIEDSPGGPTGMEITTIEDSPGGQGGGGEYTGNQANQSKQGPDFTNQTEQPTAAAGSPNEAGLGAFPIIGILVLIMIIFNWKMDRG